MMDKYLPIKIFEKREIYDDRGTEGGGSDKPPRWILSGEQLLEKSSFLHQSVEMLRKKLETHEANKRLPLVVSTTINEDAIAKSHRGKVVDVLDNENVIGFFGDNTIISMVPDSNILGKISDVVSDIDIGVNFISAVEDIDIFNPYITPNNDNLVYKVKLINYNNYDLNHAAKMIFEQDCEKHKIQITKKTKYTPELTVYRICLDNMEELELFEEFEGIYSIEPMETYDITLDALDQEKNIPIKEMDEDEDYPIVGILDSGIKPIPHLEKWLGDHKFSGYPEEYQDNGHGTFVSGIVAYGDELDADGNSLVNGIRLFDATVYPDVKKETIYADDLIDRIREAVEKNSAEIKIWNLSLGSSDQADLDEFSDFGMALDSIQDENDILIVKSAGNCTNFLQNKPKQRISKSADSVRAVVVGSITKTGNENDYTEANMPSPFTRIGPGPCNIIKPDLVHYGGNVGIMDGQIIKNGVPSFGVDGRIKYDCGTSFSTPRVTRVASELNHLINEEFDPLLIRALLVHSAQYPPDNPMAMADKIRQMGFGMPLSTGDILYNSPDEITLILRDTLERGSFIEMFDFPYPNSLVDENGFFRGQIKLTLVTKSILDEKQAGEYCQSNMNVMLGTYLKEKDRDIAKKTIKNPKGLEQPQSILSDALYSSRIYKEYADGGFERERILTKYGKKFVFVN